MCWNSTLINLKDYLENEFCRRIYNSELEESEDETEAEVETIIAMNRAMCTIMSAIVTTELKCAFVLVRTGCELSDIADKTDLPIELLSIIFKGEASSEATLDLHQDLSDPEFFYCSEEKIIGEIKCAYSLRSWMMSKQKIAKAVKLSESALDILFDGLPPI